MSRAVDFDMGGVVCVRAFDAGPQDLRSLERQLGIVPSVQPRDPDICLLFVECLPSIPDLRFIGLSDAAFSDRDFILLRGKDKSRACVVLAFEDVGRPLTLRCERGLAAVPLLVPLVNATMLAKGFLPLHASAFVHAGKGVLATGWSKGGKTETLLAFMAHGARYVADEWLYLAPGGSSMFGLPEPIRLWAWHLAFLPELRRRIPWHRRAQLSVLALVAAGLRRATADGARHGTAAARNLNRARDLLQRGLHVDLPPQRLFPPSADAPSAPRPARPERVLFVVSHERPEVVVEPIDPAVVAERMCFSLAEEDQRLVSCYHKFRFAFPERRNALLERAPELRRELLHAALDGKRAYEVRHPYPVRLEMLYRALEEVCA